jgi:hypothetical protein
MADRGWRMVNDRRRSSSYVALREFLPSQSAIRDPLFTERAMSTSAVRRSLEFA